MEDSTRLFPGQSLNENCGLKYVAARLAKSAHRLPKPKTYLRGFTFRLVSASIGFIKRSGSNVSGSE